MVSPHPAPGKFRLTLDPSVHQRLHLMDAAGQPLIIIHSDEQLLQDLELEILNRNSLREAAQARKQRTATVQQGLSIVLIVFLFGSTSYQQRLAERLNIQESMMSWLIAGGIGAIYIVGFMIINRNKPGDETAERLREDLQLREWIRRHCTAH